MHGRQALTVGMGLRGDVGWVLRTSVCDTFVPTAYKSDATILLLALQLITTAGCTLGGIELCMAAFTKGGTIRLRAVNRLTSPAYSLLHNIRRPG